jgi:hypothetical protein
MWLLYLFYYFLLLILAGYQIVMKEEKNAKRPGSKPVRYPRGFITATIGDQSFITTTKKHYFLLRLNPRSKSPRSHQPQTVFVFFSLGATAGTGGYDEGASRGLSGSMSSAWPFLLSLRPRKYLLTGMPRASRGLVGNHLRGDFGEAPAPGAGVMGVNPSSSGSLAAPPLVGSGGARPCV